MKKTELCTRAQSILWSGRITPEDESFLHELIDRHPDAARKIGAGIDHFEIRKNPKFPGKVFWLVRVDGTETDFSYRRCVNGAEPLHRLQVLSALRAVISDQVIDFKRRALTPDARCSLTGAPLNEENVHVDHDPPFIEIARAFFEEVGVETIKLAPSGDGQIGRTLLDPDIARRWADFHRARATLFLTTAKANISKGAKPRAGTSLRNSVSAFTRNAEGNDDNRAIAERQSNYDRSVETTETGAGGDRAVDEG